MASIAAYSVLIRALFPRIDFSGSKRQVQAAFQQQQHPPRWRDMTAAQQRRAEDTCRSLGFDLYQALSLRTVVYRSAQPWKFQGTEDEAEVEAEAFEARVQMVLAGHGVTFKTQKQQVEIALVAEVPLPPTPDFLIQSPLRINEHTVHWIEVKNFYGVGVCDDSMFGIKTWMPTLTIQKQISKYVDAYGSGAVVLKHGYSEMFRRRTPECVLLLDARALLAHSA